MKITIKKLAIIVLSLIGMIGFTATSFAAATPELHVQTIKNGDLNVQFRYVDKDLTAIQFMNDGKKTIDVTVLQKTYVLAPGDKVVIDPPSVKNMVVSQQPHQIDKTGTSKVLASRFKSNHVYSLPNQTNKTTN